MSRNMYFYFCIALSIVFVLWLGSVSIGKHLGSYQQGSALEGVPVERFEDAFGELKTFSASSAQLFGRVLQNTTTTSVATTPPQP